MPSTIRLHRVLRTRPERVYRAFLDADAMAKWLPPNGFTGKVHHMDARVGGTYRMSFTNFTTRQEPLVRRRVSRTGVARAHPLHGQIRRSESARRDAGDGHLQAGVCGTELNITQEGIPDVIPAEACYLGWQESLMLLAKLVEPEIPDGPVRRA